MAGPWEKYAQPAPDEGPWARYAPQGAPVAAAPIPKPSDTWTDEGGNAFQIIDPTAKRGLGQLTPADVASRMAVKPMAAPAPVVAGPTEMRAYTPEMRTADVAATRDPKFVRDQLAREPDNGALALKLMGETRGADRGALPTFAREAGNTAFLGIPRLAGALTSDVPLAQEWEMAKAADAQGRADNLTAAKTGQAVGTLAQMAAVPSAAFATPLRAGVTSGAMSGVRTAVDTLGDPAATARDALIGAVTGYGVSRALSGPTPAPARPVAMTNEELRATASAAYDRADQAGVIFGPSGIRQLGKDVKADLADFGYHPQMQPKIAPILGEIDRLSNSNVTLKGVEVLRRMANNARTSLDASERTLGGKIVEKIDDWVANAKPGDVIAGDAGQGAAALAEARSLWHRVKKSEMVDDAVGRADLRAASTGSGGNVDNATRQNLRSILDSPKKSRGFTEDERAAMEAVVRGSNVQNIARLLGKLSPSGNGLMLALQAGAAGASGGMSLPFAAVGMAAKKTADKMTSSGVDDLSNLIRGGGVSAASQPAAQSVPRIDMIHRIALILANQRAPQSREAR